MTTDPNQDLVTGLSREIETLRRRLDELAGLDRRVSDVVQLAARIAENCPGNRSGTAMTAVPTWLDLDPFDQDVAAEKVLTKLARWVGGVYLRYSDARHLADCWLWHPEVVEELLWLRAAWFAAYAEDAPVSAAGDWHDRQRPGVVRRIKSYGGMCSLEAHLPSGERYAGATITPTVDAVPVIAAWWATARDEPAPAPSAEQLEAARQRHLRRGRR